MASAMIQSPHLANPLATADQLLLSASKFDGIPEDLSTSMLFGGAWITQIAGILLRLPQDIVAQSIVIFMRFFIGTEGGSLREHAMKDISAASIYLTAKVSALPKSPRSVVNVYGFIESFQSTFVDFETYTNKDPESYYISEGTYQTRHNELTRAEAAILRVLGFQIHVPLPHTLCINYIQALDAGTDSQRVSRRAIAHLNSALLSPQLLYLTHQPNALATAAIYLAAKEAGVKLPGDEWWEVFDTDREELGFLVLAMSSMEGFVREEKAKWTDRRIPITLDEVEKELERRSTANGG